MGHELTSTDRMVSGNGVAPWHYAETQDRTAIVPGTLTISEAMSLAGLDFTVDQALVYAHINGVYVPIDSYRANFATDTGEILGVVSDDYTVIQYGEIARFGAEMLSLSRDLGSEGVRVETAGTLRGRRVGWMLFKMPGDVKVGGMESERVEQYLLGKTGHGGGYGSVGGHAGGDGAFTFQFLPTSMRVVCQNTLSWAIGDASVTYTVKHTGDVESRIAEAREALSLSFDFQREVAALADQLVQTLVNEDDREKFLAELLPKQKPSRHPDPARRQEIDQRADHIRTNRHDQIVKVHTETADLDAIRWTEYGLLQSVSAWECHHRRYANSENRTADERRFEVTMGIDKDAGITTRAAHILSAGAARRQQERVLVAV